MKVNLKRVTEEEWAKNKLPYTIKSNNMEKYNSNRRGGLNKHVLKLMFKETVDNICTAIGKLPLKNKTMKEKKQDMKTETENKPLITADFAKDLASMVAPRPEPNQETKEEEELNRIMQGIKMSAHEGEYSIKCMDVMKNNIRKLKALGYKVEEIKGVYNVYW